MANAAVVYGRVMAAVQNGGEEKMQLLNNPFTTPTVYWKIEVNRYNLPSYCSYSTGSIGIWNNDISIHYQLGQNIQSKEKSNESNLCR